jgi:hypothetical protein
VTALEPAPGYTLPGVEIPGGPTEQQATDAAVNYGWLIAVVIVAAVLIGIVRTILRRVDIRFVGAVVLIGFIAYQVGKGN